MLEMRPMKAKPLDSHRAMILEYIGEGNLSRVSEKVLGRNRAYMQQYITRGTPERLNEFDRKALADYLRVDESILLEPKRRGKSPTNVTKRSPPRTNVVDGRLSPPESGPRNLPVKGRGRGAQDVIINLDQSPENWVNRPAILMGAMDAFAVYVAGDSMEPALPNGTLAYINPAKPPGRGDRVLVEKTNGEAIIKVLEAQKSDHIRLRQMNPPKTFTLQRSEITNIFKIVSADYP